MAFFVQTILADIPSVPWWIPVLSMVGAAASGVFGFVIAMRRTSESTRARIAGINLESDKLSDDVKAREMDRTMKLLDRVEEIQSNWAKERLALHVQNLELQRKVVGLETKLVAMTNAVDSLRDELQRFEDHDVAFWHEFFDECPLPVARVNEDGTFGACNVALEKDLGYAASELHDTHYRDITHPGDLDGDNEMVAECIAGNRHSYSMIKRYKRKLGDWVPRFMHVVAYRRGGQFRFFISYVLPLPCLDGDNPEKE